MKDKRKPIYGNTLQSQKHNLLKTNDTCAKPNPLPQLAYNENRLKKVLLFSKTIDFN
ncbi:hypothetical protein LX69_02607 [Breznakibacter xylanolyticus]|uniref:Uncharacterized protein n=1 Tax=Breznakibacter xylanolyticus TaxID=990 RepID=A0A2W7N9N5_9BACT|nr:hypothetical protein LX69_02607 [Breznakibacter xylanolyticus]